jgi:hypothetical protein
MSQSEMDAPWVDRAEEESARYMTDRCADEAPPRRIELGDPGFDECMARSFRAVEARWTKLFDGARLACVRDGVECCPSEVPEDYQRVPIRGSPMKAFQQRLDMCSAACVAERGDKPAARVCTPRVISTPHDPARFRTPEMIEVTDACSTDARAIMRCEPLLGLNTRVECMRECERWWPHLRSYDSGKTSP